MTGVVEMSTPGAFGPQHLLIPQIRPPRPSSYSYATPTDVSRTLPPLTMNTLAGFGIQTASKKQSQSLAPSGMPSPPTSDCSQSYTARKQSPLGQDSPVTLREGRHTPPYSLPGPWTSPDYTTMSSQNTGEQTAYDMSFGALPIRPGTHRQLQHQNTFDMAAYAPPSMPAPSSLLGGHIVQASNLASNLASRPMPMHQSLPPIDPNLRGYATSWSPYGHSFHFSTGQSYLPMPGSYRSSPYDWQPSPYHHLSHIQAQAWAPESEMYRPARPSTILGSLPREAWERVFQYLGYADRLNLQRVNRFWAESLKDLDKRVKDDPSDYEYADMHSLVLQAENYRKHWSPSAAAESKTAAGRTRNNPRNGRKRSEASDDVDESRLGKKDSSGLIGNIGCYHCFTVRPPEFFALKVDDDNEAGQEEDDHSDEAGSSSQRSQPPQAQGKTNSAPRRYCLDCGIKKGYHPPGEYIETKAGNMTIWICCGRYYEYGLSCCPKCGRGCPLTPVNKSSRSKNSRKRSSPMPPPSSPAARRQRTVELELEQRQPVGYNLPYQHAQWS